MTPERDPPALRWSRVVGALAVVVFLLFLAYVGSAAYYALRVTAPNDGTTQVSVVSGDRLLVEHDYNLSNPGPYPVQDLVLTTHIAFPNGTPWFGERSVPLTLGGGTTTHVPLEFSFPLTNPSPGEANLLTQDASLPAELWVNGTYAYFVEVGLDERSTFAWGAPFENLTVTAAASSPNANGTDSVTVSLTFSNHASIGLNGTLAVSFPGTGPSCAGPTFSVLVSPGSRFAEQAVAVVPAGCVAGTGGYLAEFHGGGLSLELRGGLSP